MTGYTVFPFLPPVKCDTGTLAGIYNYNYFGRQKNERTDLYSDKLPDIHSEFYLGTVIWGPTMIVLLLGLGLLLTVNLRLLQLRKLSLALRMQSMNCQSESR